MCSASKDALYESADLNDIECQMKMVSGLCRAAKIN